MYIVGLSLFVVTFFGLIFDEGFSLYTMCLFMFFLGWAVRDARR